MTGRLARILRARSGRLTPDAYNWAAGWSLVYILWLTFPRWRRAARFRSTAPGAAIAVRGPDVCGERVWVQESVSTAAALHVLFHS